MIYEGKHSVTFIVDGAAKNTWEDWCLAPTSRPVIMLPSIQEFGFEIEGHDGLIDFSDDIFAVHPLKNRVGTIEFVIDHDNEKYVSWFDTYSTIANFLHGKNGKVILSDDPAYYYEGRFTVSDFKSASDWSRISIGYDLYPYKYNLISTLSIDNDVTPQASTQIVKNTDNYTFTISSGDQIIATLHDFVEDEALIDYISFLPSKSVSLDDEAYFNLIRYTNSGYLVYDYISIPIEKGDTKEYLFEYKQALYKEYNSFYVGFLNDKNNQIPSFTVKIAFRRSSL